MLVMSHPTSRMGARQSGHLAHVARSRLLHAKHTPPWPHLHKE